VVNVIDFTHDNDPSDKIGHGTFISSVIGSINEDCPGIAPDAEIYIFKLFSNNQFSQTSWFLEAFNYVMDHNIDIINLSNGSNDYMDKPFIDKINEMIANGVIVISAIGNEGPF
jgi:membrane-bound transcription factor site-1 protease